MKYLLFLIFIAIVGNHTVNASEYGFLDIEDKKVSYRQIEHILNPFKTDGCSSVSPDGTLRRPKLWQHCCIDHDVAYWKGGTLEEKNASDEKLNQCVSDVFSEFFGRAMQVAVNIGGHPDYHTAYAWGYGWNHIRGYFELDEQDKAQVASIYPSSPRDQEVENIEFNKDPIPSRNNNICLDEIQDHIEKSLKINNTNILDIDRSLSFLIRVYVVETDACEGHFKVTLNNFVSFNDCESIPLENSWDKTIKKVEAYGSCADKYISDKNDENREVSHE